MDVFGDSTLWVAEAAYKWAVEHRAASDKQAARFATWFVDNYPEGDKSLAQAFDYWEVL